MALTFQWNGQALTAAPGDSIAAALSAAGIRTFGRSRGGRDRGLFCGMGACQDCLVRIGGTRGHRACLTEVAEGMQVSSQADTEAAAIDPLPPAQPAQTGTTDLAIIGAGPAGLNAALVAAAAGASVTVLDERGETGGQYFKPRSTGYRGRSAADAQHRKGRALRNRAEASGATFRNGQTVWFARARPDGTGFDLRSLGPEGQTAIHARAVILAAGAIERPAMIPGWTRPGVMTIGAAQTLVRRYGVLPGQRILIAGNGPLGLQLAAEILGLGGHVAAVAERGRPRPGGALLRMAVAGPGLVADGLAYRMRLMRARVPVLAGWEAAEALGDDTVSGARLRRLSDGQTRDIAADTLCIGDGFAPAA